MSVSFIIDHSVPTLTANLNFNDTWHVAGGVQYQWSDAWLFNAGIAYDSGWQDNGSVSLSLPVNAVWRFGVGGQKEESKTFGWGWGFSYTTHGNLHTDTSGSVPVAVGGRGDVVGSFNDVRYLFFAANFNWKF
jgi:long-chain fatty acid transport protein